LENLRAPIKALAFPRNHVANKQANRKASDLLLKRVRKLGHAPFLQGSFDNIVMTSGDVAHRPALTEVNP
jgi:hypothetical protein